MDRQEKQELLLLLREKRIREARKSFWNYCKLLAPSFYKEERLHLKSFCFALQDFITNDEEVMIVNMPPRHGKSRTIALFASWVIGNDRNTSIMMGSYNETFSAHMGKQVRDLISTQAVDGSFDIIYSDVFPINLKYGSSSAQRWSVDGGYNTFQATSPSGSATGSGANFLIIDDIIKNNVEAMNASELNKKFEWYTNTMLSRLEGKRKQIIVMTRWSTGDLAGRIERHCIENEIKHKVIKYKALQDDGTMLCPEIFDFKAYERNRELMGEVIFLANYQQQEIDVQGALYQQFKTYDKLPDVYEVKSYTDTADTGSDYLVQIVYAEHDHKAYILDVLMTQEPMIVTEQECAKQLLKFNVNRAKYERNNGGGIFARNVERLTRELGNNKTVFSTFNQNMNKEARILANSSSVELNVFYPENWIKQFPDFATAVMTYQREGKNKHDDAVDALTGIVEELDKPQQTIQTFSRGFF